MLLSATLFIVGLLVVVRGADWLTDGASAIARRLGVSSLTVGLTVVAFGTSAPELVVSVVSAVKGQTEMAIGNVMGSNIFNSLAIMGATALITPVACTPNNIRYEVPLSVVASVVLAAMISKDCLLPGDGITLLCFFAVFLAYTFATARKGQTAASAPTPAPAAPDSAMPLRRAILLTALGLAGLILGGDSLVRGATGLALMMGVSQSTVALTIVAAGTSMPELVTSVVAARKGDTDMAMGNVVGSNIFNIFLILGVSATVAPLRLGTIGAVDTAFLLGSSALLWVFCRFGRRHHYVTRPEGAVLVVAAAAYYTWLAIQGQA